LHIEAADEDRMRSLGTFVNPFLDVVVDAFFRELVRHEGVVSRSSGGTAQLSSQKRALTSWLRSMFRGSSDDAYLESRLAIGSGRALAAIPRHFKVTGIHEVWVEVERHVRDSDLRNAAEALQSFHKYLTLDLALMVESHHEQYEQRVPKKERQPVEEKLTRAEHLAEIGQLAASLAHEIKNPLAGISGAIQIMRDTMTEEDPHRGVVSEILGQIKRLDATVKDLLHYARPLPPRIAAFFLDETVSHVLDYMREEPALRNVPIAFESSEKNFEVCADQAQIEQLLNNLLLNAAHACEDGGSIRIFVDADEKRVELRVRDDGIGMSDQVRRKAFEPLFTTKAKGTGLGLPICRRIAQEHGGSILLESALGIGTTVTVRWPRRAAAAVREDES
ncbi:MAG: hypothetical protein IH897_12450, partial [Planctomycetes bacterium]|nr:hypothetical protein [Planctomycetota bacterium]